MDRSDKELNLGMRLVPHLSEVMPDQADADIQTLYENVRQTFRVPIVNFFFRVLANYPSYLVAAWDGFSPHLRTLKLEKAADELRAAALLEPVPDASGVAWGALGDLSKIRPFTDTIHYVLPKLLLVATAFHSGFDKSASSEHRDSISAKGELPHGIALGTASIPMVDPAKMKGGLNELFQDIKDSHRHPQVATYYRSLGHWPEFLGAVWDRLKRVVGSPNYEAHKRKLLRRATEVVEGCRSTWRIPTVADARDFEEIRAICALFRFRLISDLLIDVSLIKGMLDGREAARVSRFSFYTGRPQ